MALGLYECWPHSLVYMDGGGGSVKNLFGEEKPVIIIIIIIQLKMHNDNNT